MRFFRPKPPQNKVILSLYSPIAMMIDNIDMNIIIFINHHIYG